MEYNNSGQSAMRSLTRYELYLLMKGPTIADKLNFAEQQVLNTYSKDDNKKRAQAKKTMSKFKSAFKKKWLAAHKTKAVFEKSNKEWLNGTILLPAESYGDNKSDSAPGPSGGKSNDSMLGARLKSWVEAHLGRAKRRKQKQTRPAPPVPSTGSIPPPPHLSSPESAYSTGYSTDGTSPGAPPVTTLAAPLVAPPPPPAPPTTHLYHEPSKRRGGTGGGTRKALPEVPVICATPSPRPRCRIRTNPWLGATSPNARRRHHQTSGLHCQPPSSAHYAIYNGDLHGAGGALISRSPHISPLRSPYYRCGSSDEDCLNGRIGPPETAILSDADVDTDGDTGLDGGDEEESEDNMDSPSRRRARRRRPPRRTPKSAGATPPRVRRRNCTPPAPPARERDPHLEADREAERKYRELIREAEKLLVSVSRAPLEPPHNPRIRELKATEVEIPRRSPERTHITNFMRANSPEPPRRLSPVAKRSPLAVPALVPPPVLPRLHHMQPPPILTDRPHSEPPKRKTYAREEVLQTLEGLRRSLQQQSALLAVQRTRLDSF